MKMTVLNTFCSHTTLHTALFTSPQRVGARALHTFTGFSQVYPIGETLNVMKLIAVSDFFIITSL